MKKINKKTKRLKKLVKMERQKRKIFENVDRRKHKRI